MALAALPLHLSWLSVVITLQGQLLDVNICFICNGMDCDILQALFTNLLLESDVTDLIDSINAGSFYLMPVSHPPPCSP